MKIIKTLGWGGITVIAFLLLAINGYFIAHEARLPAGTHTILARYWLATFAILLLVCLAVGYLANDRKLGILIDGRNRISLSRVQWVLWFLVLFSAYFTGGVWDMAFGNDLPTIEPNLFGLIGISSGSAIVSSLIVETKKKEPNPKGADDKTLLGRIDVNEKVDEAAFADLYLGEEDATRTSVDVSRLQKLITTFLLVIVYLNMLWSAFTGASHTYDAFDMPVVGTNFLVLLGASHAAYLAYKATPKAVP